MAEEAGDYRTYLSGFDERCYFAIYRYSMHCFLQDKTRQDKTRQLYLTRVAQSAAKLVSLGALGSIRLTYTHLQENHKVK